MHLRRNSLHKRGTNRFFNFSLLLYGIQDGFVFSFGKKEIYFYFQLENILRLFEVMKLIFEK